MPLTPRISIGVLWRNHEKVSANDETRLRGHLSLLALSCPCHLGQTCVGVCECSQRYADLVATTRIDDKACIVGTRRRRHVRHRTTASPWKDRKPKKKTKPPSRKRLKLLMMRLPQPPHQLLTIRIGEVPKLVPCRTCWHTCHYNNPTPFCTNPTTTWPSTSRPICAWMDPFRLRYTSC